MTRPFKPKIQWQWICPLNRADWRSKAQPCARCASDGNSIEIAANSHDIGTLDSCKLGT
jgi:hypothetical protein